VQPARVAVYSVDGRLVASVQVPGGRQAAAAALAALAGRGAAAGTYFGVVYDGDGRQIGKADLGAAGQMR
jgi:hypothetical protein